MSESFDWFIEPILSKFQIFYLFKFFFTETLQLFLTSESFPWFIQPICLKTLIHRSKALWVSHSNHSLNRFIQNTESFRNETERLKMHIGQLFCDFVWMISLAEKHNWQYWKCKLHNIFNRTNITVACCFSSSLLNYLWHWTTAFLLWIR